MKCEKCNGDLSFLFNIETSYLTKSGKHLILVDTPVLICEDCEKETFLIPKTDELESFATKAAKVSTSIRYVFYLGSWRTLLTEEEFVELTQNKEPC